MEFDLTLVDVLVDVSEVVDAAESNGQQVGTDILQDNNFLRLLFDRSPNGKSKLERSKVSLAV